MSGTLARSTGRLVEMGWHLPVFSASSPDQPQPGRIVRIESCEPSGYDIGSVKERTGACEASAPLYNFWVNQMYEGEVSAQKKCRPISSARPTLPPGGNSQVRGWSVPTKNAPLRGLRFLPSPEGRWASTKGFFVKITCKQQDLSRGLSIVSHAVSSRSTLPILANILLVTDQGRLKLSATNLEIGINCWIDAEIHEEGTTTVPAKLITDFVSSLPQAPVDIAVPADAHTINIKSLRSSANIKGMDPSEFPLIPTTEGGELPIILDAATLKEMITQVAFAAADDDSRPVFTGVHVEVNNEKLTFAAADAFRLAVRVSALPGHEQSHDNILIPARTLTELARILPSEGAVQMIVTPNRSQVLFHTEQIDLVSRLIEGTFPNFRNIIPKESTTRAVIETKEFAAAVKSVTPFARDSSNITRIKLASDESEGLEPGTLTIEATAEDVGSNVSTINAAIDGPEQQIIFNVKYLADVLAVLDTPEVALEVTSAGRPGVIKPVGSADYTYVIMPMSTNR